MHTLMHQSQTKGHEIRSIYGGRMHDLLREQVLSTHGPTSRHGIFIELALTCEDKLNTAFVYDVEARHRIIARELLLNRASLNSIHGELTSIEEQREFEKFVSMLERMIEG